jgi:hypothetical protein
MQAVPEPLAGAASCQHALDLDQGVEARNATNLASTKTLEAF